MIDPVEIPTCRLCSAPLDSSVFDRCKKCEDIQRAALEQASKVIHKMDSRTACKLLHRMTARVLHEMFDDPKYVALGLETPMVASGESACATVTVQESFKGEFLLVSQGCASCFDVNGIMVGVMCQDPCRSVVAADTLLFVPYDFDTAQIGQNIAMLVRNKSAASCQFQATILGRVLR